MIKKIINKIKGNKDGKIIIVRDNVNGNKIDIVTCLKIDDLIKYFDKNFGDVYINKKDEKKTKFNLNYEGRFIEVYAINGTKEELPFLIFNYSYPLQYVINMRNKAKKKGFKLNEYGLYDKHNNLIKIDNVNNLFEILGEYYRTPQEEEQRLTPKYKNNKNIKEVLRQIRQEKIQKEIGNGLIKDINNYYRNKYCGNKSKLLKDGEYHLLCGNYIGPGTDIFYNLENDYEPINSSDKCAQIHDYELGLISAYITKEDRPKLIRKSDERFIKCINETNDGLYSKVGKAGIKMKMNFENLAPRLAKKLEGEYYGEK